MADAGLEFDQRKGVWKPYYATVALTGKKIQLGEVFEKDCDNENHLFLNDGPCVFCNKKREIKDDNRR